MLIIFLQHLASFDLFSHFDGDLKLILTCFSDMGAPRASSTFCLINYSLFFRNHVKNDSRSTVVLFALFLFECGDQSEDRITGECSLGFGPNGKKTDNPKF